MPDFNQILGEVQAYASSSKPDARAAFDVVRRKYLRALYDLTGRNVIAYYSGFLSKPDIANCDINDEDKNGFMATVHNLDRSKGLDLILHTPGGGIAATESIVDYLMKMFSGNMRAIVPQIAMSAGTMMACCCRSILMAEHSNLGPIDPHLRGIPVKAVTQEFRRAYEEVKEDRSRLAVWEPILRQIRPTFITQCESVLEWSKNFVEKHLETQMFAEDPNPRERAANTTALLLDNLKNKSHDRHIHLQECREIGLKVERIEDSPELQDAILTVHHCFTLTLMNTGAYKIVENHIGVALVKQEQIVTQQMLRRN